VKKLRDYQKKKEEEEKIVRDKIAKSKELKIKTGTGNEPKKGTRAPETVEKTETLRHQLKNLMTQPVATSTTTTTATTSGVHLELDDDDDQLLPGRGRRRSSSSSSSSSSSADESENTDDVIVPSSKSRLVMESGNLAKMSKYIRVVHKIAFWSH